MILNPYIYPHIGICSFKILTMIIVYVVYMGKVKDPYMEYRRTKRAKEAIIKVISNREDETNTYEKVSVLGLI
jgi:hypothetical protein